MILTPNMNFIAYNSISQVPQWIIWTIIIWVLPWKGIALWKAARKNDKFWFITLLILNTLAILEILYIFYFSKEKERDTNQ